MQKGLKIDGTMRALAIALCGAVLTSVIAMFIPVSVFESITGATGFSELVPATGAPLGDTARALIAFGFGAIAFAVIAIYLLRQPAKAKGARPASQPETTAATPNANADVSWFDKAKATIADFVENRRNPDAVKELSDLPKLRAGDAHPDAPPRRPISAHRDFGDINPGAPAINIAAMTVAPERATAVPIVVPVEDAVDLPIAEPARANTPETVFGTATVTDMVGRLEWAVTERQSQIAKLEALASAEMSKPTLSDEKAATTEIEVLPEPEPEPTPEVIVPGTRQSIFGQPNLVQPILEVVPSEPATELVEDDMDAALRSALETLHRMNARTR